MYVLVFHSMCITEWTLWCACLLFLFVFDITLVVMGNARYHHRHAPVHSQEMLVNNVSVSLVYFLVLFWRRVINLLLWIALPLLSGPFRDYLKACLHLLKTFCHLWKYLLFCIYIICWCFVAFRHICSFSFDILSACTAKCIVEQVYK